MRWLGVFIYIYVLWGGWWVVVFVDVWVWVVVFVDVGAVVVHTVTHTPRRVHINACVHVHQVV